MPRGWNQVNLLKDPTAHAEMLAITSATTALQTRHVSSCSLFVSLEPCIMCAGAMHWAQIKNVQYLLPDDKFGAHSHHNLRKSKKDTWECVVERPWVDPNIQAIALEYKTFLRIISHKYDARLNLEKKKKWPLLYLNYLIVTTR